MPFDLRPIARRRFGVPFAASSALASVAFLALTASNGWAEGLKVHNTYGSPLDTLMSTRLTTDVPQPKDFVRKTTPDKDSLDYTPLTGTDPPRPTPRNPKQVEALQAELEGAGVKNEGKAKGLLPRKVATRKAQTKTVAPLAVDAAR